MKNSDRQLAIGARVRYERERHGWTGKDLAAKAGVSPNTVVSVERGRRVRPGTIAKVHAVLGIQPDPDPAPRVDPYTEAAVDSVERWMDDAGGQDDKRRRVAYLLAAIARFDQDNTEAR